MYKILTNYDNHPINEDNSHISCPYPFENCLNEFEFKYIFEHNILKKICKNEDEWNAYMIHAEKYAFPGYTIIQCPVTSYNTYNPIKCNSNILVSNETIKETPIGGLIIQCDQNSSCLKKFCYYCKEKISFYFTECIECKTINENENPNVYNYYFNKITLLPIAHNNYSLDIDDDNIDDDDDNVQINLTYNECDYLYINKEITEDIAYDQIYNLILDANSYMICSICKISIYKTERCNSLSHHNIERCYACGRIGYQVKGLVEHWNGNGHNGCFRFNYDSFVTKHIPTYKCNDSYCHNHEKGDCKIEEHQIGIDDFKLTIKKAYIYHMLISLLPSIRYNVYDKLYSDLQNNQDNLDLLPYRQTFLFLEVYKKRYRDYNEDILYNNLYIEYPKNIIDYVFNKSHCIDVQEYIKLYSTQAQPANNYLYKTYDIPQYNITQNDEVSAWRNLLQLRLSYNNNDNNDNNSDNSNSETDNENNDFEVTAPLLSNHDDIDIERGESSMARHHVIYIRPIIEEDENENNEGIIINSSSNNYLYYTTNNYQNEDDQTNNQTNNQIEDDQTNNQIEDDQTNNQTNNQIEDDQINDDIYDEIE